MSKWDALFAEADESERVAKMSPGQRAAYSFMTGKNRQPYLEQEFGQGNVQAQGNEFQIRANERAPWQPTDPKNETAGDYLSDVAGFAGGATEYAPAIAGAFLPTAPVAGAVGGQVLGRSAREAIGSRLLDQGTNKDIGDLAGDYAMSGGQALVAGGVGKAIGAGVQALRPGVQLAKQALKYPSQTPPPMPGKLADPFPMADASNPVLQQAMKTLNKPSPTITQRALASVDLGDMAAMSLGGPGGIIAKRGGKIALDVAREALAKRDASAIAKIMSQPGGMEMLQKLAAGGRNPAQAVIVGEEALGLGLGGR